jgi:hypothetical protein
MRLLVIGGSDAGISFGATVADIADLDLSYTPPLGSPWDAVQVATTTWQRRVIEAMP